MTRLLLSVLALTFVTPLMAECLAVREKGVSAVAADDGIGNIEWPATLENRCKLPQEGLLTVSFLAADGQSLNEVLDQAVIGRLGEKRLERRVYIPERYIDEIRGIAIELKERERPR